EQRGARRGSAEIGERDLPPGGERGRRRGRELAPAARPWKLGGQDQQGAAAAAARSRAGGHPAPGGRTHAAEVTASASARAPIGDGGRSVTLTLPPSRVTAIRSAAQPGRAARAAGPGALPAATAIAAASAAPSASVSE